MRLFLLMNIVLLATAVNVNAGRRVLDKVEYPILPGVSEVITTEKVTDADGVRQIHSRLLKKHKVKFYADKERYIYTYWKKDGSKVDIEHEQSNRVKVIVKCEVEYDESENVYKYHYRIRNTSNSAQPLLSFVLDVDPKIILDTVVPDSWVYFSKWEVPEGSPVWAFFGVLGGGVKPGDEITISIHSKYGPVVSRLWAQGRAKRFKRPENLEIDALGVHPPNEEGVKGKTLVPGVIPEDIDPVVYWENLQDEAEKWGWISSEKRKQIEGKIKERKSSQNIFNRIREEKMSSSLEPEAEALLKHLEKIESKRMDRRNKNIGQPSRGLRKN